jgi:hypothetical protein
MGGPIIHNLAALPQMAHHRQPIELAKRSSSSATPQQISIEGGALLAVPVKGFVINL